jgi:hypothetical protein
MPTTGESYRVNLTPLAWLLVPLGVCRAMQILLFDRVTEPPRRWLLERLNPNGYEVDDPRRPYFSVILSCPWCLSVYVAAAAIGFCLWDTTRSAALAVLAVLSVSLLAVGIDRMFDKWLPDQAHTTTTLYGDGYRVEGPPTEVAEALEAAERAAVR